MTFTGARVALLTQHGKERVLSPALLSGVGAMVEVVCGFDTDRLGTFTRDVGRRDSQLETARQKARIAIELSGHAVGLGSEGAFIPSPWGIGSWNVELVALIDTRLGIEVVGMAHGPARHVHGTARSIAELKDIAMRAGFPEHGLVTRPDGPEAPGAVKGIVSWPSLRSAFRSARDASPDGTVFVESDLRAHFNPTRMGMIARAGADLAARLATPCPACGIAGFGWLESVTGQPCSACGTATEQVRADIHACVRCPYREERPYHGAASPAHCPWCNP
jgi:hypothetical protein